MVEIVKLLLICAVALTATTFVRAQAGKVPSFIKSFNNLHQELQPSSSSRSNVKIMWMEQKLDHFNESETRTWKMRFAVNDELYMSGGPLFIYVGGTWPLLASTLTGGHVYDTAKEHNALLLNTEHRFYGESRPVKDMTIENLQYLDVKQALADLAHFIRTIKSSSDSMNNSKVILVGAFHNGAMVTWFKKLYPDLAVGCWALSAPLLAKVDVKEEMEAVGKSIRFVGGDSCYNRIANGVKVMEKMLAENRSAEVKRAFNICNTVDANNDLNVAVFTSYIYNVFYIYLALHSPRNQYIKLVCDEVMKGVDDFKGLSNLVVSYYGNSSCNNFTYKNEIAVAKITTFGRYFDRQLHYQMCNEFGWFLTTTSTQQPFGTKIPLSYHYNVCKDIFGDKFTPEYIESQVNKTNQLFGGLNPQVENVYMTYGQLDPWLPLGIQDVNKATIIPMHSKVLDVGSISPEDSRELKAAKMKFKELVNNWLKA